MVKETKLFTQKMCMVLIIAASIILGCSKTENTNPEPELYTYLIEIVFDGKTYREEETSTRIALLGSGTQEGCLANKKYFTNYLNELLRPTFSFQCIIKNFEDALDFSKSKTGRYNVFDFYDVKKSCNLDISVQLKSNGEFLSLEPGAFCEIVKIQKLKDNSQKNPVYQITGNFKCTFKNKNNQNFTAVGNFSRPIMSKIYY